VAVRNLCWRLAWNNAAELCGCEFHGAPDGQNIETPARLACGWRGAVRGLFNTAEPTMNEAPRGGTIVTRCDLVSLASQGEDPR